MNIKDIKIAYFIGIGGIGMSAIARYFNAIGIEVFGYDKTQNDFTNQLSEEGFKIHYHEAVNLIPKEIIEQPENTIVIYTPAIPKEHAEMVYLKNKGIKLHKRAEVLGIISRNSYTIGVAGTHGKTTTSCLLAHIFNVCNINFTAFLGGISTNFQSNYVHKTDGANLFDKPITIVEADEYDRSFLQLSPNVAIVTSTDADHLDIYGKADEVKKSFQDYINCLEKNGTAIVKQGLSLTSTENLITYGDSPKAKAKYSNIEIINHQFTFDYSYKKDVVKIINGLPGFHNIENATAAITAALQCGLPLKEIANAITTFKGVKRRFEYVVNTEKYVVIDDYAHHPTELKACIESVKSLYPNNKITGVFQPHLYSRTRDFADDFAAALDLLDECWLMDIYPAREQPIEGINSEFLAFKMNAKVRLMSKENIVKNIEAEKPELLVILGAGDIDQLIKPIKKLYA